VDKSDCKKGLGKFADNELLIIDHVMGIIMTCVYLPNRNSFSDLQVW